MLENEYTFYDACCGVGGIRLGLQRAGFRHIGSCDNDNQKREIYRKHFGEYPTHDDIRKLDGSEIGKPTVFAAGFPCPTFSIVGKRLGFKEPRGEIFFEVARIANKARPRILLLENVEGLLSHDEGRTFGQILSTLDEIRYDVEWWCINGWPHFVPQSRERVFIVGHSRDEPTAQIFPFGEAEAQAIEGIGEAAEASHCIDANYWKGPDNHGQRTVLAIVTANTNANGRRIKGQGEPAFTLTNHADIGVAIPVRDIKFNKGTAQGRRAKTDGEPSFTIKAFATAGIYDGMDMRVFTPLECERLMGFPDGWTDGLGLSDRSRYKAMGDAVIPGIVEKIGNRLMSALRAA